MKLTYIKLSRFFLLFAALCFAAPVFSQTVNPQNLSSIRVDELSDDQVRQFMKQVESTGLGESQLEQVALARGMRPEEVQKLRARIEKLKQGGQTKSQTTVESPAVKQNGRELNYTPDTTEVRVDAKTEAEKALGELRAKIFGASLFKNTNLTFEPNLRIATPRNYVIGPDDDIQIDITGDNEANYTLKVSPEGTIRIEYAGMVSVSGLTVEQASSKIRSRLAATYPGIRSGRTSVAIGIGNIRSIKVTLLGEVVKPGSYTLPSLATVFNALYVSGGPNENGSFREIEIIRGNRVVGKLDVYDFLLKGFQTNNIRLQDNDIIRVPTYRTRVEFVGEVKRPALFEVLPNETLQDVINFAGGFSDQAYSSRIKVLQNTDRERRITDVFSGDFNKYKPKTGDKYFAETILDRFENRVVIEGAVFRPGQFELEKGLTLSLLIQKAEGVKEEAFLPRGYITRLKADNSPELISFDLEKILSGAIPDIPLQREDIITISSIFDLREEFTVSITGEIREPGDFKYSNNMTLEDLIILSGGFKEGASAKRIEISRRVKDSDVNSISAVSSQVYQVDVDKDLKFKGDKFIIQPFDIVAVRNESGYEIQRQVKVEGQVKYPGTYTISRKDERISDIVERAGGLTALAYPAGASLKRPGVEDSADKNKLNKKEEDTERMARLERIQGSTQDTSAIDISSIVKNVYVGINLERILEKPRSKNDLILEEGDILRVPKQLQTVKISGEVLYPVTTIYNSGSGFQQYISQAGGFSDRSLKRRAYVVYANGAVKSTKKFLFFNNYPIVKPGAEIFVPKKSDRNKLSIQEVVGISTGLASLAAIFITLFR
ncbi:SLBB domain-containing protein [Daejeonella oryzae]|uniref:SLBB domain-containing protein n=1 Tax=Daejeonella oryzae TaxID=1122943 RepID=UPI0005623EEB|nr:SLBB domain-containing protein [Daejeonella oryzae]